MSDIEKMIRIRAYALWEHAGRPHGRSEEFWFLARAEFESEAETGEGQRPGALFPTPRRRRRSLLRTAPRRKRPQNRKRSVPD